VIPAVEVDLGPGVVGIFTTRAGGCSPAPWDSLDLGANVGDAPDRVRENRDRVARAVGGDLVLVTQVHGGDVLHVTGTEDDLTQRRADALVTTVPGVAVGVTVADCVPVLLADAERRVVAAVHAGRAGIVADVVEHAVDALRGRGARALRAVVGPCVCGACYEVSAAVQAELVEHEPAGRAVSRWGTPALDLRAAVQARLAAAGVEDVVHVARCTLEDAELFSHRGAVRRARTTGEEAVTGRSAGVVMLARRELDG